MSSMYIRTKDGRIIDTTKIATGSKYMDFATNDESFREIFKTEPLSKSENLEELCDEYCYIKDDVISQYLTIDFKFKRDDEFCALRNKLTANGIAEISKGISKYELENGELKFAIWTSKGLIYVAEMDNEGKLVLI